MTRLVRQSNRILILQAFALLGIVAILGTLPVCDAAAYSPFANASDFRTITENRDVTVVETQPGVRYLHGSANTTGAPECASCQAPDSDQNKHISSNDTLAERTAAIQISGSDIDPASPSTIDRHGSAAVSRAIAPAIQPPRVPAI